MPDFEAVRATAAPNIPRLYLGNANALKIFTEHIQTLERHAVLLSEAAEHFRTVPRVSSDSAEVQEIQNMKLRAQQSLLDARRCQQLFLERDQSEQASQASHLQEVKAPFRRARSSDQETQLADQRQLGNVKRRRVDRPIIGGGIVDVDNAVETAHSPYSSNIENGYYSNHEPFRLRALTMNDIRRAKLKVKLSERFGARFNADAWIPGWRPEGKNHIPPSTLVELEDISARVEAWLQAECDDFSARVGTRTQIEYADIIAEVEGRTHVEYEDISAEVEARIQASDRRRKENNGELEKKAVKRTWNDRNSLGSTEYMDTDELYLRRAEKRSRRRVGETFMDWSARQAYEATTHA